MSFGNFLLAVTCLSIGTIVGYSGGLEDGIERKQDFADITFTEYPQRLDLRSGAVLEQRFGQWTEIGFYDFRHGKPPVKAICPALLKTLPDFGPPVDVSRREEFPEPSEYKE